MGKTDNEIAETLNKEGFPIRQGGAWKKGTVSNIYWRAIAPQDA